ncbi:peptidoglycan DD-metalloendopeptidase family protein [Sphingomonas naphthae]|uniref:Peptidoglycan DD-metalloendopeptidase family protein n=1 Tax=Sphingomonas naphthae TaxID=1813468 RepID=A0ABY7TGL0_9SPHN|nr:peptidoglycan DD-metalloendopeptidase family protein [Sphingomonas naphthae]WCT72111.1 peptidoglycan DD-metalloendopeptidase family protein [Sphingomonas naphthae]
MRRIGIIAALGAMLVVGGAAQAANERAALASANRAAASAGNRARLLAAAAAKATNDADRIRANAAAIAASVQAGEARIALAETRLRLIERERHRQRDELARRQAPLTRVLGALETMARRPAAMTLVEPGSLRDVVHVRALIGAATPEIERRTADLRAALTENERLRAAAESGILSLRQERAALGARRVELARAEAQIRARSASLADSAMLEQERAQGLAEKARDLTALVDQMNDQASVRERLASLPGPLLRPALPGAVASPPPAPEPVAGNAARPAYRIPAIGQLVTGLGETNSAGIRTRGLTIATAPGAQVVAPAGGRVSFAGPFKGYGQVVIIDHGGGWNSLVTDLAVVAVRVGDTIVQGSPLGRMGNGAPRLTVELRRGGQTVDIARLVSVG